MLELSFFDFAPECLRYREGTRHSIVHFEGFFACTEFMMLVTGLLGEPCLSGPQWPPDSQKHIELATRPVTVHLPFLLSDPNGGGEKTETVEELVRFWTHYSLFLTFATDGTHSIVENVGSEEVKLTPSL